MAITDLTGTKWVLKASLISYPGGTYTIKQYNVNITSDEATEGLNTTGTPADTFAKLTIGYSSGAEINQAFMVTASNDVYVWAAGNDTKSLPDTWSAMLAIPFTITGGSDATNSDLIAWLEDNADQIIQRVEYLTDNIELTSIADAIRAKGGTSGTMSFPTEFVSAIQAIPTGGSSEPEEKAINFYDYDGTRLYSYTPGEWEDVSALPENPSHDGLTAQGWNWTKAQIDAQLAAVPGGDINVGQMYVTATGNTEIDVELNEHELNPYLICAVNGSISVDWGDNSSSEITGTSTTVLKMTQHTYPAAGQYTLSISVTSGSFSLISSTSSFALTQAGIFNNGSSLSQKYSNCVRHVRIGAGITMVGTAAFGYCRKLETITFPATISTIAAAFVYCNSLKCIVVPSGCSLSNAQVTYGTDLKAVCSAGGATGVFSLNTCPSITSFTVPKDFSGSIGLQSCFSLKGIVLPSSAKITNLKEMYELTKLKYVNDTANANSATSNMCQNLYSLQELIIPTGWTSIAASGFSGEYRLLKLVIPSTVATINATAFSQCTSLEEMHIQATTPPTVSASSAFNGIPSTCKFYVPYSADHSILDAYKAANIWSSHASKMVEEPQ